MDNIKLIFLSRGQLASFSFDKFVLTVFKLLTCIEFFLVSLPLLLDCSAETNSSIFQLEIEWAMFKDWLCLHFPLPSPTKYSCSSRYDERTEAFHRVS